MRYLHRHDKLDYAHALNQERATTSMTKEPFMANKEEILAGLAKIVNEETGVEVEDVQLDKSFTDWLLKK